MSPNNAWFFFTQQLICTQSEAESEVTAMATATAVAKGVAKDILYLNA